MGSMKQQILAMVNAWHTDEDNNLTITGDIDASAKERLAEKLEMMFCQEENSNTVSEVHKNFTPMPPKRRGRPPKVKAYGKKRELRGN